MRIVDQFTHESFSVTIFSLNDKYLVKIEGGPMEQTYKFTQSDVGGLSNLKKHLSDTFFNKATEIHQGMFENYKQLYSVFKNNP